MSLSELWGDYTLQNVIIGATLLGIISGVLGSFAVLRRQSLLGDTLSHAALPGICLGFMIVGSREFGSIMLGALSTGSLAALCVLFLTRYSRLGTDAAMGVVLSTFFALGVVLLTRIQGGGNASQGGLDDFLFGQAAATLRSDLVVMGAVTLGTLLLVVMLWKEFKLLCFDPGFAGTQGLPVLLLEILLTVMIALAVVVGLQMVGVVLMAAMIIAPAVAARQWCQRLETMVPLAAFFGFLAGVSGALTSTLARGLSTGPLMIISVSLIVILSLLVAPRRGLLRELFSRLGQRRRLRHQQLLTTLYQLAERHGERVFPTEQGLIDSYHRTRTRSALARLERHGLVEQRLQAQASTRHWLLTEAGRLEAERILAELEGGART